MVSSKAKTVEDYLAELPAERRAVVSAVRDLVNANLPDGYVESMSWGMIAWEVPLERFPVTCNKQPLMYAALAAQKNGYSLYLPPGGPGLAPEQRLEDAYAKAGRVLDMGKSCLRFQRLDDLLAEPIAALIAGSPVDVHIARHEAARRK